MKYENIVVKKLRKGFTLAEVLITLGIIGIVAALTIPTLINNYQKIQYVSGLKKFYSQFNQALKQMAVDNGCVNDLACTGLFASDKTSQTLGDEVVKYIKVVKNCGVDTTGLGCWPKAVNDNYDGTSITSYNLNFWDSYKFITADGMSVSVGNYSSSSANCGNNWSNNPSLGYMAQICAQVTVDVNGLKGPNYLGRDVFLFFITNGKGALLYPRGGVDDKYDGTAVWWNGTTKRCTTDTTNRSGWYCPGRIMEEGWEMNY